jgi:predicted PurR-regulated permease PerM
MTRQQLSTAFFFAVFFFLIYQLALFLLPFAGPLFLAGVLVITFSPLTASVVKAVGGSRSLAAAIMSLGVVLLVVVPTVLLLALLVGEASGLYEHVDQIRSEAAHEREMFSQSLQGFWQRMGERFPILADVDLAAMALEGSHRVAGWVASEGSALASSLVVSLLNVSMMIVALFFFFRDGDRIAVLARELIPMQTEHKDTILKRLYDTIQAVVQSSMAIAVLQGFVAGIGYAWIGGLSVSVVLGFVTGVASLVPVVGAVLVWAPTALYVMATGELGRGIGLILWGAVAVGSVDNFVRPLMIGGRVEMPTLLLLFALLGGVQIYGFLGIFVAPVVVAILIAFTSIYRDFVIGKEEAPGAESA